jgi:hypothetical protein
VNLYAVWSTIDRLGTEETIRAWTQTEAVTIFATHNTAAPDRIRCRTLGRT